MLPTIYCFCMLDIGFIRDNKEVIQDGARKKHLLFVVNDLIAADDERRALLASVEAKRKEQNDVTDNISKGAAGAERQAMIEKMQALKAELQKEEEALKE